MDLDRTLLPPNPYHHAELSHAESSSRDLTGGSGFASSVILPQMSISGAQYQTPPPTNSEVQGNSNSHVCDYTTYLWHQTPRAMQLVAMSTPDRFPPMGKQLPNFLGLSVTSTVASSGLRTRSRGFMTHSRGFILLYFTPRPCWRRRPPQIRLTRPPRP